MKYGINDIHPKDRHLFGFSPMYRDWHGKPVEKTPHSHPYSYDAYVVEKKADKYKNSIYSDRLWQWDYKKYNELCRKYFGNEAQLWDGRSFNKIEEFLRDHQSNPELRLIGIMKGCNVSSGYPYWVFMFDL